MDAYRELLAPVQARDAYHVTKPILHRHLWIGTKKLIEDYAAACKEGVETARRTPARYTRLDAKIQWFLAQRTMLGRTALFLQGGTTYPSCRTARNFKC